MRSGQICGCICDYRLHLFVSLQTANPTSEDGWLQFLPTSLFSHVDSANGTSLAIVQAVEHGHPEIDNSLLIDQVVLYGLDKPGPPVAVQPDSNHAERIVHWSQEFNVLFYLGNTQQRPEERHLFAVSVGMPDSDRSDCLTCDLSALDGWAYTHFDVVFSGHKGSRLLLVEAQGPSVPRHDVFEWTGSICGVTDSRPVSLRHVRTLHTHPAMLTQWHNLTMPVLRFEQVLLINGALARVKMLMPQKYEDTCNAMSPATDGEQRKFGLMVRSYDGPNSFSGTSEWIASDRYEEYLAVNRSVVVAVVDARGSDRVNMQHKYAIYKQLGWTEADDLLEVTE